MNLLNLYPFINIRRNHGFEHATIHVLSETQPRLYVVGRSDLGGFTVYGNVETEALKIAAQEALRRLHEGQTDLAVHSHCGTILATTGFLTGLAAFLTLGFSSTVRRRFSWTALPETIIAATLASVIAQPFGLFIQEKYTVSGEPGNLRIKDVVVLPNSFVKTHRVQTIQ